MVTVSLRNFTFVLVAIPAFACDSEPEPEAEAEPVSTVKTTSKPTWTGLGKRKSPYVATCSHSGKQLEGSVGLSFFVQCPSGCTTGGVWGSGPYTRDSRICTAAIHSGVITDDGGLVVAKIAPGGTDYKSSEAHGVTSHNWSSYDTSLVVEAPRCDVDGTCSEEKKSSSTAASNKTRPKKTSPKKSTRDRTGPKRKGGKRGR